MNEGMRLVESWVPDLGLRSDLSHVLVWQNRIDNTHRLGFGNLVSNVNAE